MNQLNVLLQGKSAARQIRSLERNNCLTKAEFERLFQKMEQTCEMAAELAAPPLAPIIEARPTPGRPGRFEVIRGDRL